MSPFNNIAPGARVVIRDAEWIVQKTECTSNDDWEITCEGVSELVKGKTGIFLKKLEGRVDILDPIDTRLITDDSNNYIKTLLFIESILRCNVPNNDKLLCGHRAAMDLVNYQLKPAIQALRQPRQRILIADGVGLGKTLEAGVLISELIRRGRGRRILAVTLKSMLTQFQKEFWNRFTIPLVRLDSLGIARIKTQIPANHNPFYFYDKTIISMDTLKGDQEYRNYLENAYWDIIIIDECHNVAERTISSKRANLAKLLSRRSDTLIMLSATPHDGRAKSFASLLNMLDPTAITDSENYSKEDFFNKGLVIRRFKKDIKSEVQNAFQERAVEPIHFPASAYEDNAYEKLLQIPFTFKGVHRKGKDHELLRVGFQKAVFSSPSAAIKSIDERIKKLTEKDNATPDEHIEAEALSELKDIILQITPDKYTKYQKLLEYIKKVNWSPKLKDDRLVIFSERIETLKFLYENLKKDLNLPENSVNILHGSLSDQDQQEIVEDFGRDNADMRLLLCSDVASEGLNLHYLCHRLIHFDMPWSLMTFQQRNGRIDRYGQERKPIITYLITESSNVKVRGDMRILEILMKKDEQAYKNIGDPSVFMKLYDSQKEEDAIQNDMAEGIDANSIDKKYEHVQNEDIDFLDQFMAINTEQPLKPVENDDFYNISHIIPDDYEFCKKAIRLLMDRISQPDFDDMRKSISITLPEEFGIRIKQLPAELDISQNHFILTSNIETIKKEVNRCRQDEKAWPKIHYLWHQHPVVEWLVDKMRVSFGRHSAPVISLSDLETDMSIFLLSGLIPNRKGQPLVYDWHAVYFKGKDCLSVKTFSQFLEDTRLDRDTLINEGTPIDTESLKPLLKKSVGIVRGQMIQKRQIFDTEITNKLNEHYKELEKLKERQKRQLELEINPKFLTEAQKEKQKRDRAREIDDIFDEYMQWIEDAMISEPNPYIQVAAVFVPKGEA